MVDGVAHDVGERGPQRRPPRRVDAHPAGVDAHLEVAAPQPRREVPGLLGEEPEPLWAFELDQHRIAGQPRINEVAFLHKPSRTLLLADWLFNFNRSDTWWTRTFLRLEPEPERLALATVSLSSLDAIGAALVAIDRARLAVIVVAALTVCFGAASTGQRLAKFQPSWRTLALFVAIALLALVFANGVTTRGFLYRDF